MATKMYNWAKSSDRFEFIIFVVVSKGLDIKEVQKQIAEGLGLPLEDHSLHIRAEKIYARLEDAKSFLIIFDDVWECLKLEKIGIPSKSTTKKRKLILTSRIQDTLVTPKKDYKILKVDVLPDEEAWKLFQEIAGDSIDEPGLVETKKEVVKHCKGLPLALVVVGSALRDKSKSMWKDALGQLERSHMPSNIPGVLKDLYIPLQWSYEQLPSEEARYIFLLCCLFPEDVKIPVELLVIYGWGLHIFKDIETIREARDRVSSLVDILKCRFLLTQGKKAIYFFGASESVNVHDVLRDMGISIASKDRYVFMVSEKNWPMKTSYENITHMFVELKGKPTIPETVNCPKLEFLRIGLDSFEVDIPDNFFSSMKGLKVLSGYGFKKTILLPSRISMLTNLRAIYLVSCQLGNMESVFGNMVNPEIISLRGSTLEAFPREIGKLKNLKVLDLTKSVIISIESSVISKLVQLEELLMLNCEFGKEEGAEDEKMKVLAHTDSLNNLVNLQIDLFNSKHLLSLDQLFPPKLERFVIILSEIGESDLDLDNFDEQIHLYDKIAFIGCEGAVPIKSFFLVIIRSVECLMTIGDCCIGILNELGKENFHELKYFSLRDSKNAEYLVPAVASQSQLNKHSEKNGILFSALESLFISDCENLKEICFCPPSMGSFGSLKQIDLRYLPKLKHGLSVSKFQICSSLEVLEILDCPVMEHIFWEQNEGVEVATIENKIKFIRLKEIRLIGIQEMEVFCKGIEEIEFPALQTLHVLDLPKMTNFISTANCNIDHQFLFSKKILFPNLKSLWLGDVKSSGIFNYDIPTGYFNELEDLYVIDCDNLKNIMAPSLAKSLKSLKELFIRNCEELEEVIMSDQDKGTEGLEANMKQILFPQLQSLTLINLPKMYTFCHMTGNLELPSPKVIIDGCPSLKDPLLSKHQSVMHN